MHASKCIARNLCIAKSLPHLLILNNFKNQDLRKEDEEIGSSDLKQENSIPMFTLGLDHHALSRKQCLQGRSGAPQTKALRS